MKTVEITIADKRRYSSNDKSIVFTTSGYGGKFFSLPFSQIKSKEETVIPVNDNHSEKATTFVIPLWLYERLSMYFELMSSSNILMPKP
jgi:hypothetical protein